MAKKKKEKIIYYDDESTLVDMSSVTRSGKKNRPVRREQNRPLSKNGVPIGTL